MASSQLRHLDPLCNAYLKLYICDINSLKIGREPKDTGLFYYKSHIVQKVDIVGVVVKVEQRTKLVNYAVDDGTGVINCCCWRNNHHEPSSVNQELKNDLPDILRRKLDQLQVIKDEAYDLGDLVNIRGNVKIIYGSLEISAIQHVKVTDCMMEVYRMLELPLLYTKYYDKPPILPDSLTDTEGNTGNKEWCYRMVFERLKHQIDSNQLRSVEISPTSDLMREIFSDLQVEAADVSECIQSCVNQLKKEGLVYTTRDVIRVTGNDSNLKEKVLALLRQEIKKPKYQELGCHIMHILDLLHSTMDYKNLTLEALKITMSQLEGASDIISVTDKHYTVFE